MSKYSFKTHSSSGIDYRFITLTPNGIIICFTKNSNVILYLTNDKHMYSEKSSYIEEINNIWNINIFYYE